MIFLNEKSKQSRPLAEKTNQTKKTARKNKSRSVKCRNNPAFEATLKKIYKNFRKGIDILDMYVYNKDSK